MEFCFPIEEYTDRDVCMHCQTEQEANIFLEFLHGIGRTWCDGSSYISHSNFDEYTSDTCYYFNKGTFGDRYDAVDADDLILSFSDYWFEKIEIDNSALDDFFSTITIH